MYNYTITYDSKLPSTITENYININCYSEKVY